MISDPSKQAAIAAHRDGGTSPPKPGIARRRHWPGILVLMVFGFALCLRCLACKPFWFDECFSVEVSRLGWHNFLHLLWWREANMSLYYLLLRIWLHFGNSPFFIRSLSAIIAVATIPAIFWLANLLCGRRVAAIAAVLLAFNAYDVRYAQETRSYALLLLLATLSSAFLIACVLEPSRRNRFAYVAISILAVYAHFYALLLIAAQWLALRWKVMEDDRGGKRSSLAQAELRRAWLAIGIGVSPLLIFVLKTGAGPIKWIQRPSLHDLLAFFEHLAGGNTWTLLLCFAVASALAVMPFARRLFARDQDWQAWRCRFLLIWFLFPIVLTVLLSFARPVFLGRYMIFCLPALLILVAVGIDRLRQRWLIAAAVVAVLVLSSQGIAFVYTHDFDNERDASGAATNFILDHTQPGDAVVFHIAETRIPYEFFRSLRAEENTASPHFQAQLGPEILFPHHADGLDYRDFTGKPTANLVRSAAMGHPRIWLMLMNNGPAAQPDPTTVMMGQVLPEFLPTIKRWEFTKVEVRLYSKD